MWLMHMEFNRHTAATKVSTVTNAYKGLCSNSYAEKGVLSFQLKSLVFSSTRVTRLRVI